MKVKILCGISGSGKSTMVQKLVDEVVYGGDDCLACSVSADDYFINDDGDYDFDPKSLPLAHAACLRKFVRAVTRDTNGDSLIIVDNTNTTVAEIAPYAALALAYGADLELIIIDCDLDIAAKRQVHGVPRQVVEQQHSRLTKLAGSLPPWWSKKVVKAG